MAKELVSLNIPDALVQDLVQRQVEAAVITAMQGSDALVSKIVQQALNAKVDDQGRPSNYSHSRPYLEYLCTETIRSAARKAMESWASTNQPKIEKAIEAEMKRSSNKIAKTICEGLVESSKRSWLLNVKLFDEK